MKEIIRILLIATGTIFVALGILGMFLPILPTTPFLLLAAYCYARSSKRFYNWLITNRWCGEYIRNYKEGNGVTLKHKVMAISLLWLLNGYSVWFIVSSLWVRLILLAIAIGVTIHLLRIKTYKPEQRTGSLTQPRESTSTERPS